MEFGEKLQTLRKQKGLTQESLAEKLFVSRTAVSKWESGRGYPGIDSLKAIAKLFSVSIDELLSGEQLISLAQEEQKQRNNKLCALVFGLLDLGALLLLFLPFFRETADGAVQSVSLLSLGGISAPLGGVYFSLVAAMAVLGVLSLALQNFGFVWWDRNHQWISLALNFLGLMIYVVGLHPYAAVFMLLFLMIKTAILLKKR